MDLIEFVIILCANSTASLINEKHFVHYFVRFVIKRKDYGRYQSDYVKLYVENIHAIVTTEDTSRPFVYSSPSNGIETTAEGWIAKNPQSPRFGDGECLYP